LKQLETTLPSGLKLYNYSISCIVQVFDCLDCFTTTSISVSVNKDIENNINLLKVISLESSTNNNNNDQIEKVKFCNLFIPYNFLLFCLYLISFILGFIIVSIVYE
jgi:hypothetical protein